MWIWEKIELLSYGVWISETISKVNLIMVFGGSYLLNLDDNRGATSLGINCIDTERYAWVSLPISSQVSNSYISELTGLYTILSYLVSLCQIYQLHKVEMFIGWNNKQSLYKAS